MTPGVTVLFGEEEYLRFFDGFTVLKKNISEMRIDNAHNSEFQDNSTEKLPSVVFV